MYRNIATPLHTICGRWSSRSACMSNRFDKRATLIRQWHHNLHISGQCSSRIGLRGCMAIISFEFINCSAYGKFVDMLQVIECLNKYLTSPTRPFKNSGFMGVTVCSQYRILVGRSFPPSSKSSYSGYTLKGRKEENAIWILCPLCTLFNVRVIKYSQSPGACYTRAGIHNNLWYCIT